MGSDQSRIAAEMVRGAADTKPFRGHPGYQNLDNYSDAQWCQLIQHCGSAANRQNNDCYQAAFNDLTQAIAEFHDSQQQPLPLATYENETLAGLLASTRWLQKNRKMIKSGAALREYLKSRYPLDACLERAASEPSRAAAAAAIEALEEIESRTQSYRTAMSEQEVSEARSAALAASPKAAIALGWASVSDRDAARGWQILAGGVTSKQAGYTRLCRSGRKRRRSQCDRRDGSLRKRVDYVAHRPRTQAQTCEGSKPCVYTDSKGRYYRKRRSDGSFRRVYI